MTADQLREISRCIFREANDAFFLIDPADLRVLNANPTAQRLTGRPRKELVGRPLTDILDGDGGRRIEDLVQACRTTGYFAPCDGFYLLNARGNRRAVHLSASRIHTEPEAMGLVVARDIERLKRAQAALRDSEERLRLAADLARMGTWEWDLDADKLALTPPACRLLEVPPESFEGTVAALLARVHPEDGPRLAAALQAARTGAPLAEHFRPARAEGAAPRWLALSARHFSAAEGKPNRLAGVVTDVTAHVESAAQARERRFRALVENGADVLVVLDGAGTYQYVSPAAARVFGWDPAVRPGRPALDDVWPEDVGAFQQILARAVLQPRASAPFCVRLRHRDTGWCWAEGTVSNLLDDPAVCGLVLNFRDVTERKRLEEDLRQAQKMEAVGRLAGGVAHDFNNLLTVITGYTSLLASGLEPAHAWQEPLNEVLKAAERAAALTRQLLAFSRKQVLRPIALDLNRAVAQLDKMLRRVIREDVEIAYEPAADLWPVLADPAQIDQIVLTLATNARDGLPRGGRVTLATANLELTEAGARALPGVAPGRYVCLSVTDNGPGLDEAARDRLFEPFYTTRELGKGTGLGLASVYGAVKQSGGSIHVESAPGRGTRVVVLLPPALEETHAEPPATAELPRGTETVLLVEDEEAIRGLARRVLQRLGYTVLTAAEGNQALSVAEQHGGPIHLLATDVIMPTLRGPELARRLLAKRPGVKVLFMSGYTDSVLMSAGLIRGETHWLGKPFAPADLARAIREALDAKPAAGK